MNEPTETYVPPVAVSRVRRSSRVWRVMPSWNAAQMEFNFAGSGPVSVENAKRLRALSRGVCRAVEGEKAEITEGGTQKVA